jgi:GT2 family glycosyltransferase
MKKSGRIPVQPSPPGIEKKRPQILVSVLCRSMNRPELVEALESVNRQSYSHIEIVLVDATGNGLSVHKNLNLRVPVREMSPNRPLNRPAAANLALRSAQGELLLFLDEDDWIAEDHIGQLVKALEQNTETGVAYSSTRKATAAGALTADTFDVDYDPARLRRDNFIPIHSAMFRKSLLDDGAGFDENLEIFEDWDFWLQLAARTHFIHIDATTAFYRQGGESNTASSDPMTRYQSGHVIAAGRERVFNKWLPRWNGRQLNQTLGSMDEAVLIQSLHTDIRRLNNDVTSLNNQARELGQTINKLNQNINRKQAELLEVRSTAEQYLQHINMLQGSLSWRVTRPLRWLRRKLDGLRRSEKAPGHLAAGPIKSSLDSPNAQHNEFGDQLVLAGWCCSQNGIDRIEAKINGTLSAKFSNGISRPDVKELFPDLADSQYAGFHHEIPLQELAAGQHTFELRFFDNSGENSCVQGLFYSFKKQDLYNAWYWRNAPDDGELAAIKASISAAADTPSTRFHVLITEVFEESLLMTSVSSLTEQVWPHWTLHIQSDRRENIEDFLEQSGNTAEQIHWHDSLEDALRFLTGTNCWTLVLKSGETLAPHALSEFATLSQSQDVRLMYSDHDVASPSGDHSAPIFTPQWSPEHLLSNDYIGGVFAFSSALQPQWHDIDFANPAWRYALLLRVADTAAKSHGRILRVPKVLWSACSTTLSPMLPQHEAAALRQWLANTQPDAQVLELDNNVRAVLWPLNETPKVSIIIPTMGKLDLIKPCIDSLIEKTSYPNFEVVILDNSRGKFPEGIQYLKDKLFNVIECNEPFNWARLNNTGTRHATGDLYLFLNDDIEITTTDWLEQLVRQALRPDVGTVGALLYYPNGALQHTGVLLVNYGGGGIHLLHKRTPSSTIYRQLHQTVREVSANTGACLMVSREKFEKIGGFDEELAVVGNDVDLCIRMLEIGYRNVWTPLCHLIHHESISRKTDVPKEDEKAMWKRWSNRFIAGDEYYNPNLCTHACDFTLRVSNVRARDTVATVDSTKRVSKHLIPGVNLIGYTRAEMGIGEGARSDARALDASNEPFGIICVTSGNPSRMKDLSWQHKETDDAPYDITLLHVNPDHALQVISELPSAYFDDHYRIGYWAWELPEIPEDWEKAFVHFDEIWVPSSFVQDAVAARSPVPVVRIPHAIEIRHDESMTRNYFGLPDNKFLFLMMFDTHSRQERKNPYGAIEAFRNAFSADDLSVSLVVKVNNSSPEALASLQERAGAHQNILFLDKIYTRLEVNAIIANANCFVSLHRSEGFGFGPAEAMALGKVVIATNWSGNVDYMRPDNSICVNYRLITLDDDYGPYKKGQIWAEPDLDHASRAMRSLSSDPAMTMRLGKKARQTIEEEFSPQAVGKIIRKRLAAIRTQKL